jgi:hypothetical protein
MNFRNAVSFSIAMIAVALAADAPLVPTPEKVLEDYKKLERITKEPKPIAAELSILCRSTPAQDAVKKETGPHAMRYVNYYLNEAAQHHFAGGADEDYPTGSVLVKEKQFGFARDLGIEQIEAVAGMIKGAPGSNPQTHDWEFFYFYPKAAGNEGDVKPLSWIRAKDVQHCAGCHSSAKDMVFARFNEPYKTPESDKK